MTDTSPENVRPQGRLAWLPICLAALLAALAWRVPPDGHEHADLAQFFGRTHPLIVHVPIALLLLVPLMELAGASGRWAHVRAAAGFVLWVAAVGAVASASAGWLLGWSGGYNSGNVTWHMWSGIALAGLASAAALVRSRQTGRTYLVLLLASVALMVFTGEQGGEISHGDDYLTEFMPARMQRLLGLEAPHPAPAAASKPVVAAKTAYAARIAPLLQRSCVSCHNARRAKGGLRLDSYEWMMKGSKDGLVVEPWDPENSEIIRRVSLPSSDEDFMPSDGRKPLSPEEVRLFERWIAAGASSAQPARTLQ
jgi:uncharacterized membrane protein